MRRVGNKIILEVTEPNTCELCGAFAELRPYGPGGKNVCFKCAMKDSATMDKVIEKLLNGEVQ